VYQQASTTFVKFTFAAQKADKKYTPVHKAWV